MRSLQVSTIVVVLLLLSTSASASAQDVTTSNDLPRFQQVSERLYRSGQPRGGGLTRLRELGIDTIINLRGASKSTKAEEVEARDLGLNYFNVALPNWGRPQDVRVARILEILAAPENGRVLVHCKDGTDRTGMIVAIYRMKHEGWSSDKALAEAERNGMRRIQVWMRDYAEDYGEQVAKNDFGDRLGAGMRFLERGAFRSRRVAGRFLRKLQ